MASWTLKTLLSSQIGNIDDDFDEEELLQLDAIAAAVFALGAIAKTPHFLRRTTMARQKKNRALLENVKNLLKLISPWLPVSFWCVSISLVQELASVSLSTFPKAAALYSLGEPL